MIQNGGNNSGSTGYFERIQQQDVNVIILTIIYNHQIESIIIPNLRSCFVADNTS